jgi:hypothetical protein
VPELLSPADEVPESLGEPIALTFPRIVRDQENEDHNRHYKLSELVAHAKLILSDIASIQVDVV